MVISEEVVRQLGVRCDDELVLELEKALHGLKHAGRLWNKLLDKKLVEIGGCRACISDSSHRL